MRFTLGILFLGAFLIVPLPGFAERPVQVGGGVTTSLLGYTENELDTSRLFWGGHARVRFVKFLGAEFSIQKREDNFSRHEGTITIETRPVQLSAIVYPLGMLPVTPYVLGGTGWYRFNITIAGDVDLPFVAGEGTISLTKRMPHVGVGLQVFFGDHFAMGADVRRIFLEEVTSGLIDYKLDAYLVNIAATFYL